MWAPSALRVLVGLVALADVRASVQAPLGAQHAQHDLDSESPITFTPFSAEAWARAADRASELAAKMTREEKLNITRGVWGPCQAQSGSVPRLGVPGFCYNDGRE
jgi:beta-glucosidase